MTITDSPSVPMPEGLVQGPAAWYGRDLEADGSWLEHLSEDEISEILAAVESVNQRGLAMLDMTAADFPLPTLAARMRGLARELDQGRGFWVLRGLPIDQMTERDAAFAYWGLGLHMGTPVSQNARGHLLGHVIDEGVDFKTNAGARGYQTRLRLPYHTDSSDVVGLLCLNPAKSGGLSSVASTTSAYNEVVKRRPDLAHLWFEQWHFDRRNEQQPGQDPFYLTRLATWDGSNLSIRYVRSFLESAQRHDAVPAHTADQTAFLELVDEISNEEGFALKMDFRPGDMQFVCNYTTFHSRTAYEDHEDPAKKRHLLRLWLTLHEGRPIPDDFGRGAQAGKAGRGGIEPVPGVAEEMAGTYA
ncbi:MAG: TauD/TfdA family dioxygenase [Acidimicrobiales bacterium]|nr:TauD/TfdA family dioxygenase [Acidimicrobiales bacterium]